MTVDKWLERNGTRLDGQLAVVTGGSGSLGRAAAEHLCLLGARVILAVRNEEKGEAAAEAIRRAVPDADVRIAPLDLSSLQSVAAFAERLTRQEAKLDILLHSAGIYRQPRQDTADGLEMTAQVNAVSPLWLTQALLPLLRAAPRGRSIAVTSLSAYYARFDPTDWQARQVHSLTEAYARSKRLLALGIHALQAESGARLCLSHPGISATGLFSPENHAYSERFLRFALPLMRRLFMSPSKAALSAVYACCHDVPSGCTAAPRGLLQAWGYPRLKRLPAALRDEAAAREALFVLRQNVPAL